MKVLLYILILGLTQGNSNDNMKHDLTGCIRQRNTDQKTIEEYSKLQIVTDLIHLPLREIARREIISEQNYFYNDFLTCSWKKYEYQTKNGTIVFASIERALRDAFVREVGATGPGINLSKIEAKNIINHCKNNITGVTAGHKVVQVQNCILKKIQHIGLTN